MVKLYLYKAKIIINVNLVTKYFTFQCPSGKFQARKHLKDCEARNDEEGRKDSNFIDLKVLPFTMLHHCPNLSPLLYFISKYSGISVSVLAPLPRLP